MTGGALCVCGDTQEEHRRGTGGCREPECGCGRFEPTGSYAATPAGPALDVAALLAEAQGDADREAELAARLAEVERERDANMRASADAARKLIAERDGAAEQWAKAREEIERLRAQLDETATSLHHAQGHRDAFLAQRDQAWEAIEQRDKRIAGLEALLEHAEQHSRDLQDDGVVLGDVLHSYDAWQCDRCGRRYTRDTAAVDHACGPMQPVTVTVSRRSA